MNDPKKVAQLKALRKEIDALLASIPDRLKEWEGLQVRLGPCRYDADGSFTFKLEGTLPGGKTREEADYAHLVEVLKLPTHTYPRDKDGTPDFKNPIQTPGLALPPLGTFLTIKSAPVMIVGARLKAKFNVVVAQKDGKRVCYKAEDIARIYAKQQGAKS
jgi:hypothetical protein